MSLILMEQSILFWIFISCLPLLVVDTAYNLFLKLQLAPLMWLYSMELSSILDILTCYV